MHIMITGVMAQNPALLTRGTTQSGTIARVLSVIQSLGAVDRNLVYRRDDEHVCSAEVLSCSAFLFALASSTIYTYRM